MATATASGPTGRLNGSFVELFRTGCIQTGADVHDDVESAQIQFGQMYNALMIATGCNPCLGCPEYRGGSCRAYQNFHSQAHAVRRESVFRAAAARPVIKRCKACGFRIRGANHEEGDHHRSHAK